MFVIFLPTIVASLTYFLGKKVYHKVDNRWLLFIVSIALTVKSLTFMSLNYTLHFNSLEKIATVGHFIFYSPAILSVFFANTALYFSKVKSNKIVEALCLGLMVISGGIWVFNSFFYLLIGSIE